MITKKLEKGDPELRIVVTLDFAQIPAGVTPEDVLAQIPVKFEDQVQMLGEYDGENAIDNVSPETDLSKKPFPALIGYTIDVVTP